MSCYRVNTAVRCPALGVLDFSVQSTRATPHTKINSVSHCVEKVSFLTYLFSVFILLLFFALANNRLCMLSISITHVTCLT